MTRSLLIFSQSKFIFILKQAVPAASPKWKSGFVCREVKTDRLFPLANSPSSVNSEIHVLNGIKYIIDILYKIT